MRVRQADLALDYDGVLAVWRSAEPGVHVGPSDTPDELARKLQRDPDLFLVAEVDGVIAGAVLGGFDGRRGLVYHLAVSPRHRRRGIATTLMAELDARLRAKGCRKYYLLVLPDNAEAVAFYQRLGLEVMPITLMIKALS